MSNITSRERILNAANLRPNDRVARDFGGTLMSCCTPEFLTTFREFLGYSLPQDRDADGIWVDEKIQRFLKSDLRSIPLSPPRAVLKEIDYPAYLKAESDFQLQKGKRAELEGVVTHAVRTHFPMKNMDYQQVKQALKAQNDYIAMPAKHLDYLIEVAKDYRANGFATSFWLSSGPFERGCWFRGYDQFCMDLILEPEIAELICQFVADSALKFINDIVPALAPYVDIFCFGDDLATQKDAFMSPTMFMEQLQPFHKQMYQRVLSLAPQSHVFHHCCGSSIKLLPGLRDAGATISNPTQITAASMDTSVLREVDYMCFHGGIDLQDVLSHYTPDQVKAEVKRVVKEMNNGKGYICAPCHSLPEDVSLENILAMFEALDEI